MRRHFLIDASALIPFLFPNKDKAADAAVKKAITKLLRLHQEKKAVLRIPNFCMAECAKGLANILFKNGEVKYPSKQFDKALSQYQDLRETLLDLVSKGRNGLIQSYALDRKHLVGIEEIFEAQFKLALRDKSALLSGLDALIIRMGKTLAKPHGRDNVFIVTADQWVAQVCEMSGPPFPRAIYAVNQPIPDG